MMTKIPNASRACGMERSGSENLGAQHLADPEAYRRDRRKDALLQQHGYFVMRFLADDAGRHLDQVLDAILAALVHRKNSRNATLVGKELHAKITGNIF